MPLHVIGAGLPRTGTTSLRSALETLLGGRCYHMQEVFDHLDHVPCWRRALAGDPPDWQDLLGGYAAIVDWPGAAFWQELVKANPDALVILSVRPEPGTWWQSADRSIFDGTRIEQPPETVEWQRMFYQLLRTRLTPDWADEGAANEAYERHNDQVREAARSGACQRFLGWRVTQGWRRCAGSLAGLSPTGPSLTCDQRIRR